jgi:hypothetical protein
MYKIVDANGEFLGQGFVSDLDFATLPYSNYIIGIRMLGKA